MFKQVVGMARCFEARLGSAHAVADLKGFIVGSLGGPQMVSETGDVIFLGLGIGTLTDLVPALTNVANWNFSQRRFGRKLRKWHRLWFGQLG